jgi:hypothetical protein
MKMFFEKQKTLLIDIKTLKIRRKSHPLGLKSHPKSSELLTIF